MKQYNVVLILTDQQRKDSLGCYGNTVTSTPNLDFLASSGVRFDRGYVANPICMPNRLSLFTGRYPRNHGLWTNGLLLSNEVETLGDYLSTNGYQTASFGKMHFTPYGGNAGNYESEELWKSKGDDFDWNGPYWGFEKVEFTIGHTSPVAHYGRWFRQKGGTNEMLRLNKLSGAMESGVRDMPIELHDSTFVAERTVDFIKNSRDKSKPFFAVASFPDPHHPFNPPSCMAKNHESDNIIEPVGGKEDLQSRPKHYMQHYEGAWHRNGIRNKKHEEGLSFLHRNELILHTYAMVELIDDQVGHILKALEEENLLEETIIIFTSDHGELLGDHGLWFKGPFFYEGLINIPVIISLKGVINPSISKELVSTVDIYPTLCELLQIPIPESVDGISHAKHLITGEKGPRERCLIEYRNGYGRNDCSAKVLVTDDYKYVRYQTGECELTDLKKDPDEKENVVYKDCYQAVVNELAKQMLDEILKTENKLPVQISHA